MWGRNGINFAPESRCEREVAMRTVSGGICGAELAVSEISSTGETGAGLVWGLAGSIAIGSATGLVNMLVP